MHDLWNIFRFSWCALDRCRQTLQYEWCDRFCRVFISGLSKSTRLQDITIAHSSLVIEALNWLSVSICASRISPDPVADISTTSAELRLREGNISTTATGRFWPAWRREQSHCSAWMVSGKIGESLWGVNLSWRQGSAWCHECSSCLPRTVCPMRRSFWHGHCSASCMLDRNVLKLGKPWFFWGMPLFVQPGRTWWTWTTVRRIPGLVPGSNACWRMPWYWCRRVDCAANGYPREEKAERGAYGSVYWKGGQREIREGGEGDVAFLHWVLNTIGITLQLVHKRAWPAQEKVQEHINVVVS